MFSCLSPSIGQLGDTVQQRFDLSEFFGVSIKRLIEKMGSLYIGLGLLSRRSSSAIARGRPLPSTPIPFIMQDIAQ
jgi:hypothetical protein